MRLHGHALLLLPATAGAQGVAAGKVEYPAGRPLQDAQVTALRSGSSIRTTADGRFAVALGPLPDTIVVRAVGFRPDTTPLAAPSDSLTIVLTRLTLLEEIAVMAVREPQIAVAGKVGEWSLGQRAIRAPPAAVEADVLRSLALVPAITFSSVFSARPLMRGYEPNHAPVRVDGFEMPNLYRLGRMFSSFPADATDRVTVSAGPAADLGEGLAGHIDIEGRGGAPKRYGGGGLSFGSLGAFGGGRPAGVDAFGAVRFLHVTSAASLISKEKVPATFLDGYGRFGFGRRGTVSVLYSGDDYGHLERQDGARWHSALLGGRFAVVGDTLNGVAVEAAYSRFYQDIRNGPTDRGSIDGLTRLDLARVGVSGHRRFGVFELDGGLALQHRGIQNQIGSTEVVRLGISSQSELPSFNFDRRYDEAIGTAQFGWSGRRISGSFGLRAAKSPWATALAPRVSVGLTLGGPWSVDIAVGRSTALHQFVSSPPTDLDLGYYDYWVPAGFAGAPRPEVDHLTAELRWRRGAASLRTAAYLSAGRGLLEVQPLHSQRNGSGLFRTGRSRAAGLEVQWSLSPPDRPDRVASLTYVWSRSRRDFGEGWAPWSLDRRHVARLQLASTIARRWRVDLMSEYTSAPPYTPVVGLLTPQAGAVGQFIFGKENSARDIGRLRTDVGFTHHFDGPGTSRLLWGISLINVTWGPIAPLVRRDYFDPTRPPVGYERLPRIPIIPTLTLRIEF